MPATSKPLTRPLALAAWCGAMSIGSAQAWLFPGALSSFGMPLKGVITAVLLPLTMSLFPA